MDTKSGGVKLDGYTFYKSTRPSKKLMVKAKDGSIWIHFGDSSMEHYKDKTGIWSHKDHGDKKRRLAYRKRHEGIRTKDGKRAIDNIYSPAYFSYNYLW